MFWAWTLPAVGFNPRARRGRDLGSIANSAKSNVSIHAPAGGATFFQRDAERSFKVSIHAPAGGATRKR